MTKHRSSDERRDQILTAARKCFIERGYESTRMQDISRESGLSKGGIYFHFDSKMQVFDSLVDEEYEKSMSMLEEMSSGPATASAKLGLMAQSYLSAFSTQTARANFFIVMSEVALREESVKEKLLKLQEVYITVLAGFFEDGIAAGELRSVPPRAAAIFVKSLLDGLEGNIALGLDLELETLIPAGVGVLLHGVANTA